MSASRKPRPTTKILASASLPPIFELILWELFFVFGLDFALCFQREVFAQMGL
jgi:hypothetical protein